MRRLLVFLTVVAMVFAVTAAYAVNDFTITDNGWTYREHNIDKPGNQQAAGQPTNFFFQNEGNDIMQQNWWWFRAGGTTGETALTNQTAFQQFSPNAVQVTYLETASNGAPLQFVLNYTLTGISPSAASVEIDWSATNTSTTLSTPLNVFSYTNTKLLPNPNQQNVATVGAFSATSDTIQVTSNTNPTTINLVAQGAGSSPLVGWRVDDFKDLLNDLTDNTNTNFPTTSQSETSVNAEAGFQWANAELGPGGQTGGILFKNVTGFAPIPDSSTLILAIPGILALLPLRRRRK